MTFSARRIWGSSSTTSTRGRSLTPAPPRPAARRRRSRPGPGSDSTQTRPPFASTKPRTIASPSPSRGGRRIAGARGRTARRSAPARRRDAGPAVDDAHEDRARRRRGRAPRPDGRPSSGPRSRAGWRTRARAARRRRGSAAGRGRSPARRCPGGSATSSTAASDDLLDRAPLRARLGGARLQARQVEQVVDQAREPLGLAGDVGHQLAVLGRATARSSPSAPAAVRIAVSGERRSCETARSSAVLTTSERRSAAVSTTSRCSASRSIAAASMASSAGTTRSRRRSRTAGSRPAGTSSVPSGGSPSTRATRRSSPSHRPQLDRGRRQLERVGEPLRDGGQRLVEARAAQQQPRHLGGQVGLLAALVRLARAHARALGQGAGDQGGDEEDGERDPVLALGDREAARGRDVEEVERERAGQRGRRAEPAAPHRGDEQHGDEVDDAEGDDRRDLGERVDQRGRRRHRERGDGGSDGRRASVRARHEP